MGQLEDLRAFVRIVEHESIGKAAEQAGVAKSALSRRLRLLEDRLGTELISRTTRQWALTPAGRSYFAHARRIISAVEEADAEIANEELETGGEIRISAPQHYGTRVLSDKLVKFGELNPNIHLYVDFDDRFADLIREGYDLAVRISDLPDSSLIAKTIGHTQRVFCASPEYLGSHPTIECPDDLKAHRIIQVGRVGRFKWTFEEKGKKPKQVALTSTFNSNNGEVLLDAARSGQGVVRLPDFIAGDALKNGVLVRVLERWEPAPLPISILYAATHHQPRRVRKLLNFLSR